MAQTIAGTPLPGQASGQTTQQLAAQRMQQEKEQALVQQYQAQQAQQAHQEQTEMQQPIVHEYRIVTSSSGSVLYKDNQYVGQSMKGYEDILLRNEGLTSQDVLYKNGVLVQEGVGLEAAARGVRLTHAQIELRQAEIAAHEEEQKFARGGFVGREAEARLTGAPISKTVIGVEAAKQAEKPSTERTFFLGTAEKGFRERPIELTRESGKAITQNFQTSYENVYGTQTIGMQQPSATQADTSVLLPHPAEWKQQTAFDIAKEKLDKAASEFYRPKQFSIITGIPAVKTTYEYTTETPMISKYTLFGFPVGERVPATEGTTYLQPSLFGKTQETRKRIESRTVTPEDITRLQILGMGVALTAPIMPKAFIAMRADRKVDIWSKIPTMRESAKARGEVLTRKIEFGSIFKEPSGKGTEMISGKQKLISIQEQKPVVVYESPIRKGMGMTGQRGMRAQASILEKLAHRQIREQKIQIPQSLTPKLSSTPGIIPIQNIQSIYVPIPKQTEIQVPILQQKQKSISVPIQKPVQIPITLQRQIPTSTTKITSIQTSILTPVVIPTIKPILRQPPKPSERITTPEPPKRPPPKRPPPEPPKIPIIFPPSMPSVDVWGITKKRKKGKMVKKEVIVPFSTLESVFNIQGTQSNPQHTTKQGLDVFNIAKKRK